MSIFKKIFLFLITALVIFYISIYIYLNSLDIENFIKSIENNYNLEIVEDNSFKINTFPKLTLSSELNIKDLEDKIIYQNININASQHFFYYPGNLQIEIKKILFNNLVFENISIFGKINYLKNYFNNQNNIENIFDGNYTIIGKLILETTSEEKLLISFLKLYFEKLENNQNYDYAFSKLINTFLSTQSKFSGMVTKDDNIFYTNNILISNESNSVLIKGKLDSDKQYIDSVLKLSQNNKEYLKILIRGDINQPEIIFDENSNFFKNLKSKNNIIEENILKLLNNFLSIND